MPSSWAERKTRMAISPRLATISLRNAVIEPPCHECGMWNAEYGMRNRKAQIWILPMICPFRIPNSPFRISSGFGLDRILEHSDRYDRRANQVAGLEECPGCRADARWGSGGNDVSGLERDELRQERDDGGYREDHLRSGGLLLDLTVDRELQRQCLRVWNRVGRENARAHRAEGVMPLAVHPVEELVPLAGLPAGIGFEATVADVVDDRVPGYAAQGFGLGDPPAMAADDHAELALPVDLVGRDSRNDDRISRMGERRARGFHEYVWKGLLPLGRRASLLRDMLGVIPGQEQQLGRAGDRHQKLNVLEGHRELVSGNKVQPAHPRVEIAGQLIRAAVGGKQLEQVLRGREKQLHAGVATVGLGRLIDRNHHVVAVETREHHVVKAEPAKTHPLAPDHRDETGASLTLFSFLSRWIQAFDHDRCGGWRREGLSPRVRRPCGDRRGRSRAERGEPPAGRQFSGRGPTPLPSHERSGMVGRRSRPLSEWAAPARSLPR